MTIWFDTHSHLQDDEFAHDFEDVLARARLSGVRRILMAASNEEDAREACRLTVKEPMLYAAIGVHPHDAKTWDEGSATRLKTLWRETCDLAVAAGRDQSLVAIGEIGLDFHYDFSPRDVQHRVFRAQLELASELDLPVIIHMREATEPMLTTLAQAHADGLFSKDHPAGVIHCYSGSAETVPRLLELGFMIGFDGPLTFKNAIKPLAALAAVPLDRLVLETDAPWLTPVPYRGKRNEPSYLPLIGTKAAQVLGITAHEVAEKTTANALKLFRIT
ncbi:MAG TPA: TatD family hydrolase [Clostridia bacterium]|nr:TatD family hydrolase [Clostridia bacterium]